MRYRHNLNLTKLLGGLIVVTLASSSRIQEDSITSKFRDKGYIYARQLHGKTVVDSIHINPVFGLRGYGPKLGSYIRKTFAKEDAMKGVDVDLSEAAIDLPLHKGDTVWVWTGLGGGPYKRQIKKVVARIVQTKIGMDWKWPPVTVYFDEPVPMNSFIQILSSVPLPDQDWRVVPMDRMDRMEVIQFLGLKTNRGGGVGVQAFLSRTNSKYVRVHKQYDPYEVIVLKVSDKGFDKLASLPTDCRPYIDLDGDGFPEFVKRSSVGTPIEFYQVLPEVRKLDFQDDD